MRVEAIYRYPVKGLSPEALEEVALSTGRCLPHDRRFALAQGDAPFDPAAPSWLPKRHFGCLMVNARLALLRTGFDPRTGLLAIRPPDGRRSSPTRGRRTGARPSAPSWPPFSAPRPAARRASWKRRATTSPMSRSSASR